jgi:hypothetical protein
MNETVIDTSRLVIPVDSEHGALRLSVVGIFIAAWVITFAIVNSLIVSEGLNIIALIGAFVVAGVAARVSETWLQKRWPSGRTVEIDARGVRVTSKGTVQNEVNTDQPGSVLLWRFQTKRRSRVPKGHFVIACGLEQDDNYLTVYTFASPQEAEALQKLQRFTDLSSEKDTKARDARQDSLRYAGEQRRLRLAETHRWNTGAEMSLPDFERFLTRIKEQFESWIR